jgi:cytochrome c-type biogenesis protein
MSGADAETESQVAGADADLAADAGGAVVATGASGGVTTRARPSAATPASPPRGRAVAGTALFVLGFSAVFCLIGLAVGGVGNLLLSHVADITRVLGAVTILLGLLFFGAFDRFMFASRSFKPAYTPRAGLLGAPLLGVMFGVGWTPCIGPTLSAALILSAQSGTAARGAFLAFVYGLGLGIPFLIVAALLQRALGVLAFFKRNARMVTRIGGGLLVVVGLLEVTGAWMAAIDWLKLHWFNSYVPPI